MAGVLDDPEHIDEHPRNSLEDDGLFVDDGVVDEVVSHGEHQIPKRLSKADPDLSPPMELELNAEDGRK